MAARKKTSSGSGSASGSILARLAAMPGAAIGAIGSLVPSGPTLGRLVVLACWLAGITGIVVAFARGVPKLQAWAAEKNAVDPSTVDIRFDPTPTWMPSESMHALVEESRNALTGGSVLDAESLERLHRQLASSGWFERVEQVRRVSSEEIVVDATFLVPFALVRSGDADYVVDSAARRLPIEYAGPGARPKLPLIVGVNLPKPAEAGTPWIGQDIRAALRLAALIRTKPWYAAGQVASIDLSRFANDGMLELITDKNTRVIWGGDPDARSLGEMPPERKLASLDAWYYRTKRIDDANGRPVDLRFDVITVGQVDPTVSLAPER